MKVQGQVTEHMFNGGLWQEVESLLQSSVKLTNSDTFTKAQIEERKWLDVVMEILKK